MHPIPHIALALSRKVDECKPLAHGSRTARDREELTADPRFIRLMAGAYTRSLLSST